VGVGVVADVEDNEFAVLSVAVVAVMGPGGGIAYCVVNSGAWSAQLCVRVISSKFGASSYVMFR